MTFRTRKLLAAALCVLTLCSVTACAATISADTAATTAAPETVAAEAVAAVTVSTEEPAVGGWEFSAEALADNPQAQEAFTLATEQLVGANYEPLALLGTQVVAGTNYCILCRVTIVYPGAESTLCLMYLYQDLEGNVEITDIQDIAEEEAQIANPFQEVSSLAEAAEIVGFDMTVPEAPASHPDTVIRVLADSRLVEVLYVNAANETEESQDELYRVRKAAGSDDISGDYNSYPQTIAQEIGGVTVTLRGEDEKWSVAVWASDGYAYAVDAQDHPLTLEEMTEIISAIS